MDLKNQIERALGERDRIKLNIFKYGEVKHPLGDFVVDKDFVDKMIQSFRETTKEGYYPPILVEHKSNGEIQGIIIDLKTDSKGLWAVCEMAKGVVDKFKAGIYRNISPSFIPEKVHENTGKKLKNLLREVSLVSVPHLKNLEAPKFHYSMSDEETGETIVEYKFTEHSYEEESVDMEELMKEMMAMLAEIKDMLKPDEEEEPAEDKDEQDMEDKDMEEGKDKEMSDNSETVELNEQESLKEKIASLEYELKAQRVLGEVEKELSGLDEQTKKDMAALKIANKDFYERLASQMKKNNITLGEVGEVGTPSQVIMNFSEAKKAARKAGCKAGEETLEWISKHYPQFV
jgi:hypothetical protein